MGSRKKKRTWSHIQQQQKKFQDMTVHCLNVTIRSESHYLCKSAQGGLQIAM